jgi:DNA polymerase-3 subunit alpha
MNAYLSAYTKAHFTKVFFASYLSFAKDKINPQDEIKELIQNANEMDVQVRTPDLRNLNRFFILKDDTIYFGLTDIKGLGQSVFDKIVKLATDSHINMKNTYWLQILFKLLININSVAAKALIQSGAVDFTGLARQKMLYEYNIISNLTKKELEFCLATLSNKVDLYYILQNLLYKHKISKNRKANIENLLYNLHNPPHSLDDQLEWIADCEFNLLGYSLSCSRVDLYDISMTNTSCREFNDGASNKNIILGGEITGLNITQTKTGKTKGSDMAFVTLQDNSGSCDSVIFFPETYKKYRNILFDGHVIIVQGNRSKNRDSLVVEKTYVART